MTPAFTLIFFLAYSSTLKMEAICSSEISVGFKCTTRGYIPEDSTLQNHCSENVKSYEWILFWIVLIWWPALVWAGSNLRFLQQCLCFYRITCERSLSDSEPPCFGSVRWNQLNVSHILSSPRRN
jgi:hypothetical protein